MSQQSLIEVTHRGVPKSGENSTQCQQQRDNGE
jgi:hypothetical protein